MLDGMERRYRITVRGHLGERFGEIFGSMDTEVVGAHTSITGRVIDQANLDGILSYLRNLGIELASLEIWDVGAPAEQETGVAPSPSIQGREK
jgi:hypothetical protein